MIAGYAEKYFTEFTSDSYAHVSMGAGQVYRVSFLFRGFSGSATGLYGAETTVSRRVNEGIAGVKTTEMSISMVVQDTATFSSFFTDNDRDVLAVFKRLVSTSPDAWETKAVGWVTPWDATEPNQKAPYSVKLSATCGLGSLQDFKYDGFPGKTTLHDVIYNCLLKTGYELPLKVACYIYEDSHAVNGIMPAYSYNPLKNIRVDAQEFVSKDTNCFEILSQVADAGILIQQCSGAWHVELVENKIDKLSSFVRIVYDSAADESPSTETVDLVKPVLYNAEEDELLPLDGGSFGAEQAVRSQNITFEYGDLVNRLSNGLFSSGLSGWTINPAMQSTANPTAIGTGTEDNPFGVRVLGNAHSQGVNKALSLQSFFVLYKSAEIARTLRPVSTTRAGQPGAATNQESHVVNMTLGYVNTQCSGPLALVRVTTDQGQYFLTPEGSWIKNKTDNAALTADNTFKNASQQIEARPTKGETLSVTSVEPVPGLGNYTISLFLYQGTPLPDSSPTAQIVYRDCRITIDDKASIIAVKEVVNVSVNDASPINRKKQEGKTLKLGDQTSWHNGAGLRYGAFLRIDGTPTKRWWQLTGSTIVRDKWQNHAARRIIRMKGKIGQVYEGDVVGDFEPLDIVQIEGKNFLVDSFERDENRRTTSMRALELLNVTAATKLTAHWESSDGIPFEMPVESATYEDVNTGPAKPLPRQNGSYGGTTAGGSTPASPPITTISNYLRSKMGAVVQGKVVQTGYNPDSNISGHVLDDSGAIVQTVIPNEWLFLSQTL